jgi:hypothetical protein
MSDQEIRDVAYAAAGAAVGAIFASTGRIVPHPETEKPWPYLTVLAAGLLLMGFEPTRAFGIGMTAYGFGKSLVKGVSGLWQGQRPAQPL